jgi:hypothetical protein
MKLLGFVLGASCVAGAGANVYMYATSGQPLWLFGALVLALCALANVYWAGRWP